MRGDAPKSPAHWNKQSHQRPGSDPHGGRRGAGADQAWEEKPEVPPGPLEPSCWPPGPPSRPRPRLQAAFSKPQTEGPPLWVPVTPSDPAPAPHASLQCRLHLQAQATVIPSGPLAA